MNLNDFEPRLKAAITNALPDGPDAVYNAVVTIWKEAVPALVTEAMSQPSIQQETVKGIAVPLIAEVEDAINDAHDDPKTADTERSGLRRASRIARNVRRAITDGTATS